LRADKLYTLRVRFRGRWFTTRGYRDELVYKLFSALPNFTATERARLFSGPSGNVDGAKGFSGTFEERQVMLDAAGIRRVTFKVEVLG
jgi:hypothetical protein